MSATPKRERWQPSAAQLHHEPQAVKWARKRVGMSAKALASAIGVAPSLISEIEAGTRNATPERLEQIAEAVRIPAVMLRRKAETDEVVA